MNETVPGKLINRYPGVKPFSAEEQLLFFGRANELAALSSIIFIKQTVVLYGKSGYGKSSLINAGILPRLKQNDSWAYFSIRFNNFSEKEINQNLSPSQTTKQRFAHNIPVDKNMGFYSLIPDEDSFWYWIKQNQLSNSKSKFILFFDQFEELFTYPKEQVTEFSEQLSQLLYTTVPSKFKRRIAELDETNPVSDALHEFIYEKPEIKVVFSIRSDRLSLMNMLTDRHPSILQNCYELDALNSEDAASAIIEPAKLPVALGFNTPSFEFTNDAVNKILESIANAQDGKIEAATLQIVCRYIEDTLVFEKKLTLVTADNLGNITDIFQQYYEAILNKLPPAEKVKTQHLIEDELIEGGRRNPLTAGYIQNKFGLSQSLLVQLEQSSLLRKERDAAGRILYEISHDTLIAAITKVAEGRRTEEEEEQRRALEQQIEEERKRADDLNELKNKAVFRFRLAVGLAVVSIVIAVFAVFSLIKANEARNAAKTNEAKATEAESHAKINEAKANDALYNLKKEQAMSKAREAMTFGDDYRRDKSDKGLEYALSSYQEALKFIKDYKNDSLYTELTKRIDQCRK